MMNCSIDDPLSCPKPTGSIQQSVSIFYAKIFFLTLSEEQSIKNSLIRMNGFKLGITLLNGNCEMIPIISLAESTFKGCSTSISDYVVRNFR